MSNDEPSAARLLRARIAAGDIETFDALYTSELPAVFALALRLSDTRAAAEDVTSETFLIAWRRRATIELNDDRPLRPWLLGIATQTATNAARARRRRRTFLLRQGPAPVTADIADGVASRIDDERALQQTRSAIHRLPRQQLEAVALCILAELTYADAAAALGVPVSTVRSRLSRARERLRQQLEQDDHTSPRPRRTSSANSGHTVPVRQSRVTHPIGERP